MGPSNGMPDTISAALAALMQSTSWGLSWSAPRTVPTMWTSLRKPSGNEGRSGRSMSRQVRMAWSLARPSRRKNEPGIFPAAYMRSSMSTVSGKKSMPSRTDFAAVAVSSAIVSPIRATTAPSAWRASLPVSKERVLSVPETAPETAMASATCAPFRVGATSGQFPVVGHPPPEAGARRLAADLHGRPMVVKHATSGPSAARAVLRLSAQAEFADDLPVPLDVVLLDVVEEATATTDELHQAPTGVMVALVHLEMLGEVVDALREDGDLHLGRAGVRVVEPVLGDRGGLVGHTRVQG